MEIDRAQREYREWFDPAFMIALGAQCLPFIHLHGMGLFSPLAAALWAAGLTLSLWVELPAPTGAWLTAAALFGRRESLGPKRARGVAYVPSPAGIVWSL